MTGREAIQAYWQAGFDMGVRDAQLGIVEVSDPGDTAVGVSQFKMFGPDQQLLGQGNYIVIWHQEQGRWRLHCDISSSSLAVAQAWPPTVLSLKLDAGRKSM